MSTQRLMAATTHMHLNVKITTVPPPRILEDTRPTKEDEETQRPPSPMIKEEDSGMKDIVQQTIIEEGNYHDIISATTDSSHRNTTNTGRNTGANDNTRS
ncbi:hypothetical protein DFP73DRAFT_596253 [Morchella snyderi]|nr:hypothetical protein DFP73DRAFT_596253 [Morchella snyderi]